MKKFKKKSSRYFPPTIKIFMAGGISLLIAMQLSLLKALSKSDLLGINSIIGKISFLFMIIAVILVIVSLILCGPMSRFSTS